VTLSKTQKKGREHKESLVTSLRNAVEEYNSLYVFSFDNMRNTLFKELRHRLQSNSRFFMGSIKVLQIALGRTDADEIKEGLHKASKYVHGDRGLLLTNLPKDEILKIFENFEEHDFARTGSIATETVELNEGPLEQFTHDMEPFLRKQGMPVRLNRGVVELVADYTVCKDGEAISPEASRILRLLEVRMATFRLSLVCRWSECDFEVYQEDEDDSEKEDEAGEAQPLADSPSSDS
jgi:mRNA turnover protein 4